MSAFFYKFHLLKTWTDIQKNVLKRLYFALTAQ